MCDILFSMLSCNNVHRTVRLVSISHPDCQSGAMWLNKRNAYRPYTEYHIHSQQDRCRRLILLGVCSLQIIVSGIFFSMTEVYDQDEESSSLSSLKTQSENQGWKKKLLTIASIIVYEVAYQLGISNRSILPVLGNTKHR